MPVTIGGGLVCFFPTLSMRTLFIAAIIAIVFGGGWAVLYLLLH